MHRRESLKHGQCQAPFLPPYYYGPNNNNNTAESLSQDFPSELILTGECRGRPSWRLDDVFGPHAAAKAQIKCPIEVNAQENKKMGNAQQAIGQSDFRRTAKAMNVT